MNADQPDLWRSQGSPAPIVLWDMLDGPMPRGLLGVGDPNVHLVDDRWTLFVGGFTTTFRNRLFRAHLVDEGSGPSGPWRVDRDPWGRARPLAADPPKGSWDAAGMHTPSYVPPAAGNGARIYYSGRPNTWEAWIVLTERPTEARNSARRHRLRGGLATRTIGGRVLEQWQYEVTAGGRIWYCPEPERQIVWVVAASPSHPKATD